MLSFGTELGWRLRSWRSFGRFGFGQDGRGQEVQQVSEALDLVMESAWENFDKTVDNDYNQALVDYMNAVDAENSCSENVPRIYSDRCRGRLLRYVVNVRRAMITSCGAFADWAILTIVAWLALAVCGVFYVRNSGRLAARIKSGHPQLWVSIHGDQESDFTVGTMWRASNLFLLIVKGCNEQRADFVLDQVGFTTAACIWWLAQQRFSWSCSSVVCGLVLKV